MKLKIKILKDFYDPLTRKTLKPNLGSKSIIEIDADEHGTPINSFWYEQLRFERNKSYFEIQEEISQVTKKSKSK